MNRAIAFWTLLSCALIGVVIYELGQAPTAVASGHAPPPPPPAGPPAPPSHAELRERYRKRMEEIAQAKEDEKNKQVEAAPAATSTEKDIEALHALLKDREKKMAERELQIETKERELNEKQVFLEQQLGKYEATVTRLRGELKSLEAARDEKVSAFRQIYEKMEAKKAARILDDMDVELSSKVLGGMKQSQAAEILSKMDPEKARRITKRFLASTPKP